MTPAQASELSQPALEASIGYYFTQKEQFEQKAAEMNTICALLVAEHTTRFWEQKITKVLDSSK
jgi:hypothetical protein